MVSPTIEQKSSCQVVKSVKHLRMGIHETSTANAMSANNICDHHIFHFIFAAGIG